MNVYNYDPITKEFTSISKAQPSPLEDGIFLIPAFSTSIQPPMPGANEAVIFDDVTGGWTTIPDFRGVTYYMISDGAEVTFNIGEKPDLTIMQDTLPANIAFQRAKEAKKTEIRNAFKVDSQLPVTVNNVQYHGNIDSALRLDGALRLAEKSGATSVSFTDINNVRHTLTLADANNVIIAVGKAYEQKFMKKQALLVDVDNAADQAALDAIIY